MKALSFVALAIATSGVAQNRGLVVVRAPSTISDKEHRRLIEGASVKVQAGSTLETDVGDLIVKVGSQSTLVVSKDSRLMEPVRLAREIFALGKKFGTRKLIPFTELSPLALNHFRRDLMIQFPRYDVNGKSCFVLSSSMDRKIRAGDIRISEGLGPTSDLSAEERKTRRDEFSALLNSAPLVSVRTEQEALDFKSKWQWTREGSFYNTHEDERLSIELERRGLEIFQGWFQVEMDRIDSEMISYFANDKSWDRALKGRTAKTLEELRVISPSEYQDIKNHVGGDYDIYGFPSSEKALDALASAKVSYRFRLKLMSSMQGNPNPYTFSPVN